VTPITGRAKGPPDCCCGRLGGMIESGHAAKTAKTSPQRTQRTQRKAKIGERRNGTAVYRRERRERRERLRSGNGETAQQSTAETRRTQRKARTGERRQQTAQPSTQSTLRPALSAAEGIGRGGLGNPASADGYAVAGGHFRVRIERRRIFLDATCRI
jgi:hypothetical protein